jgi:hypothetical protein
LPECPAFSRKKKLLSGCLKPINQSISLLYLIAYPPLPECPAFFRKKELLSGCFKSINQSAYSAHSRPPFT